MGVAVSLLPVTGQTLPLISSGGSSIWMTCAALGIILNVTKKEEEIKAEQTEKELRDAALQKLIDQQLAQDEKDEQDGHAEQETKEVETRTNIEQSKEEEFSIEDHSKGNPMDAVKFKP
jgi:cell division protein FtsW